MTPTKPIKVIRHAKLVFFEKVYVDPRDGKRKRFHVISKKSLKSIVDRINQLIVSLPK